MSRRRLGRASVALACASAAALSISAPAFADETAVGLSTDSPSSLVTFPVTNPGSAQTSPISFPIGAMDTNLVGLDYRPRSNQLYARGSLGTLYVLNPPATPGRPFTAVQVSPGLGAFPAGADTGLDFNPMADAVRVVNENDENYRFNPLNGNGGAGTAAGGKDAAEPGRPECGGCRLHEQLRRHEFDSAVRRRLRLRRAAQAEPTQRRDARAARHARGEHHGQRGPRRGAGVEIEFRTDELPVLPKGEYYELWFVSPGDRPGAPNRISAGTFHPDEEGRSNVRFTAAVDPAEYPRLAVTAEPGDGDPAPTSPDVMRSSQP
jgi:hypothetical protein